MSSILKLSVVAQMEPEPGSDSVVMGILATVYVRGPFAPNFLSK